MEERKLENNSIYSTKNTELLRKTRKKKSHEKETMDKFLTHISQYSENITKYNLRAHRDNS